MTKQNFVLMTHHGTIVCVDPATGDLVHRTIKSCEANLVFNWRGAALIRAETYEIPQPSAQTRSFIEHLPLQVEHSADEAAFGFKVNGAYACAEDADEKVTFSRPQRGGWESFSPMPIVDLYEAKIASFKTASVPFPRPPRRFHIPKTIHQIFIAEPARTTLPDRLARNTEQLRQLNPGWAYRLWTKKDIHDAIYDWYGFEVLELYLKISPKYPAARADLFRYLCLYRLGGVYLDIKSSASQPFGATLNADDQFLLSKWNNGPDDHFHRIGLHPELEHLAGGEFQQWHVIGAPGHPFLEQVILDVLHNITHYDKTRHGVGRLGVLRVTGPIAYTFAIQKMINLHEHRIFDAERAGMIYHAVRNRPPEFYRHYTKVEESVVL